MRLVKEIVKESARSTATVTASTAIGVGLYEGCGYVKDSALRFFDNHRDAPAAATLNSTSNTPNTRV